MYDMISNILLSWLPPHAEDVTVDHQCGFQCDKSTTDHIFYIHHITEKKLENQEPQMHKENWARYKIYILFFPKPSVQTF
jgi:hypothetical protein